MLEAKFADNPKPKVAFMKVQFTKKIFQHDFHEHL